MFIYIALLRGINVGGKNVIKMPELKKVFEAMEFREVKTYIQSGNVIFKSNEEEEDILKGKIEEEISKAFGLSIPVILRKSEDLKNIIENCPFSEFEVTRAEEMSKVEALYVSFLLHQPLQENIDRFKNYKSESDSFVISGRDVYLLFYNSIRNSKLANNLQKLDTFSTVRNWKTISKIFEIAKEMEDLQK